MARGGHPEQIGKQIGSGDSHRHTHRGTNTLVPVRVRAPDPNPLKLNSQNNLSELLSPFQSLVCFTHTLERPHHVDHRFQFPF
jgi:hypothetical protein